MVIKIKIDNGFVLGYSEHTSQGEFIMKYEMIPENGMFRIKALQDFGNIKKGDLGGLIEKEINLSQEGDCWVSRNAKVFGNAVLHGNAKVFGTAEVFGNAIITKTPFSVNRTDDYTFILVKCLDEKFRIIANCRYFTFKEAYEHWNNKRQGSDLQKETLGIVKYLEGCIELM